VIGPRAIKRSASFFGQSTVTSAMTNDPPMSGQ